MGIKTLIKENDKLKMVNYSSNELLEYLDSIELVFQNVSIKPSIVETIEKKLCKFIINQDGVSLPVYYNRKIKIFDPPLEGSPGSDAKYYIWDDETGLLLQFIPPNSRTSYHYHKITREEHHNILGKHRLYSSNGEITLKGSSIILDPYNWHQILTLSNSSINTILMDPPGLGKSDHFYFDK